MAIAGNKLLNLTGAKALYDDLRERVEAVDPTDIIDDTAGDGDTDKVWSADKVTDALAAIPAPTSIINDSAGDGVTDKVWSANKVFDQLALKAVKANPVFTGAVSHQRANETTVGSNSVAMGSESEASGDGSIAIGYLCKATGDESVAMGDECESAGTGSVAMGNSCRTDDSGVAIGSGNVATGTAVALGKGTKKFGEGLAFGKYNSPGGGSTQFPVWVPGKLYMEGDCVRRSVSNVYHGYVCTEENDDTTFDADKWDEYTDDTRYLETVGKGTRDDLRSNARTLDTSGNEVLAGTLTCNTSITIGSTTITEAQLIALLATL